MNSKESPDASGTLSLQACKKILQAKKMGYSDEDVLAIRDFLQGLARIEVEHFLEQQKERQKERVQ